MTGRGAVLDDSADQNGDKQREVTHLRKLGKENPWHWLIRTPAFQTVTLAATSVHGFICSNVVSYSTGHVLQSNGLHGVKYGRWSFQPDRARAT